MTQNFLEICGAFEILPDALILVDQQHQIVFCNHSAEILFGYSREELTGGPLEKLIPVRYRESHKKRVNDFVPTGKAMQMTDRPVVYALTQNGEELPVSISITSIQSDQGRLGVAVVRSAKAVSAKIDEHKALAETDPLTGVGNRRHFSEQLTIALTASPPRFALLFIDLNGFKKFNDTYGHEIGDEVLRIVAKRLRSIVRNDDVLARLGGDEFVLIAKGVQEDHVLHRLLEHISSKISEPLNIQNTHGIIGASVGYAIAPQDGLNEAELVRQADKNMYAAKRAR